MFTWRGESLFYLERGKFILPGDGEVLFTWRERGGEFFLPGGGEDKIVNSVPGIFAVTGASQDTLTNIKYKKKCLCSQNMGIRGQTAIYSNFRLITEPGNTNKEKGNGAGLVLESQSHCFADEFVITHAHFLVDTQHDYSQGNCRTMSSIIIKLEK